MTAERWQQIRTIHDAVVRLHPAERAAAVARAAGGDAELRREVMALLESEAAEPPTRVSGVRTPASAASPQEQRIGVYRIVRELGAGGMGVVYLAERTDEFKQNVAIKLLRRGMDSEMVVGRFRNERQILAGLDHPNIAHLLDGGATREGLPYFVMEYVDGQPIDSYCTARNLGLEDRLRLFRKVCAAVQYAHQNLVVHRDLKTANILVTAEGAPKLLDFGIAKLLRQDPGEETPGLTQAGMRLMTPEYASPEQVRGLAVTTASDVYSLGVVLYELLCGSAPYRFPSRALAEVERVVCEQEPQRPSTLGVEHRQLAGDLDNIVLKAMEKDPRRRYQSVEQFSDDIGRYLDHMPVLARAATLGYRAGKFVRRNRTSVVAAALVLLSLVGGLAGSLWQAHIARVERARAERRFNDVRKLAGSFLFEFHDRIKDLEGATEARRLVVAKALEYLDSLAAEAAGDPGLELELAEAYLRLGDVQGNPFLSNIGDTAGALKSYEKARHAAEEVLREDPRHTGGLRALGRSWQACSDVLPLLGRDKEGVAGALKAVESFRTLVAAAPKEIGYRVDLASSMEASGDVMGNAGISSLQDTAGAVRAYRESLEQWQQVLDLDPKHARARRAVAVLTMKQGDMELQTKRLDAAQEFYERARTRIQAADLSNPENLRVAGSIGRKLAYVVSYKDAGRALEYYRGAMGDFERMVAIDPRNTRARMDMVVVLREMGDLQRNVPQERGNALASYRRALEYLVEMLAASPANVRLKERTAEGYLLTAGMEAEVGTMGRAREASVEGLKLAREVAVREGAGPAQFRLYAETLLRAEPRELRNPGAALQYAELASQAVGGKNPEYLHLMAEACFQAGRAAEAVANENRVLELLPPESAGRAESERHLKRYQAGVR